MAGPWKSEGTSVRRNCTTTESGSEDLRNARDRLTENYTDSLIRLSTVFRNKSLRLLKQPIVKQHLTNTSARTASNIIYMELVSSTTQLKIWCCGKAQDWCYGRTWLDSWPGYRLPWNTLIFCGFPQYFLCIPGQNLKIYHNRLIPKYYINLW